MFSPKPKRGSGPSADVIVKLKPGVSMDRVSAEVSAAGATVNRQLRRMNALGLTTPRALIGKLESISGVASVREDGGFQLPPFDERIPQ